MRAHQCAPQGYALGIHPRTGRRYPFLDWDGNPIGLEYLPAATAFPLAQMRSVPSSCTPPAISRDRRATNTPLTAVF
jgi:hypothetical protein